MRNRIKVVCAVGVCVLVALGACVWYAGANAEAAVKAPLQPDEALAAAIAKRFDAVLPRLHISHESIDAGIATNAVDLLLSMLDYDRSMFLASDIEEFRREAPLLPARMAKGDVSFAFRVFERFKERVADRVAYADRLLEQGFDLTVAESYCWKRKDLPWPADTAEWNELWRKKVKNEYVARVVAKRLAAEDATNRLAQADGAAAAATSAVPAAAAAGAPTAASSNAPTATNGVLSASARDALLSPEAFIRNRYKQYLTVLADSDADFVMQRYFAAFTQAYDPHSEYMTASSTEDFDINMKLSLVGIGALLSTEDGAARIEQVMPGGPADRDGRLKAGDKIIAVAQGDKEPVDVLHWPLYKTVRLIRGAKGTKVVLTVIPATDVSGTRTVAIDLVRDEVKLEEQAAKSKVSAVPGPDGQTNRVGVITLPAFYADMRNRLNSRGDTEYRSSTRDMARLLEGFNTQALAGVIVDLRNNGGGSLAEAVEMTGLFLTAGPVVQVRGSRDVQVLSDPDPDVLYTGPLVVLVNRQSASASEILAAALQDYGRALIVGDSKTHGKGTVQSLQSLDERNPRLGSLKVTTHSFHRIVGTSTQLNGVKPDLVIPSIMDVLEIGEEHLRNPMRPTVVASAAYRPVGALGSVVPELKARSERRRAADARFAAQQRLMDEIAERQRSNLIALSLDERMKQARAEKSLDSLQADALNPEGGDEAEAGQRKDKPAADLVLQEAERIVVDLANLEAANLEAASRGQ